MILFFWSPLIVYQWFFFYFDCTLHFVHMISTISQSILVCTFGVALFFLCSELEHRSFFVGYVSCCIHLITLLALSLWHLDMLAIIFLLPTMMLSNLLANILSFWTSSNLASPYLFPLLSLLGGTTTTIISPYYWKMEYISFALKSLVSPWRKTS